MKIHISEQVITIPENKQEFVRAFLRAQGIKHTIQTKAKSMKDLPMSDRTRFWLRELQLLEVNIWTFVHIMPRLEFKALGKPKTERELSQLFTALNIEW